MALNKDRLKMFRKLLLVERVRVVDEIIPGRRARRRSDDAARMGRGAGIC